MPSQYTTLDGYKCDKGIIDACWEAISGHGDGRVSRDDAQKVYDEIADGGRETRRERWTKRYCLAEFKFTDAARVWLIDACKSLKQVDAVEESEEPALKRQKIEQVGDAEKASYEMVDGMQLTADVLEVCRIASATGDCCVSLESAKTIFEKIGNGGTVTRSARWTVRYCLAEFKWTRAAAAWITESMQKVDHESSTRTSRRHGVVHTKSPKQEIMEEELAAARSRERFAIELAEAAALRADAAKEAHKMALAQLSERDAAIDRVADIAKELVDIKVQLTGAQAHLPVSDTPQHDSKSA